MACSSSASALQQQTLEQQLPYQLYQLTFATTLSSFRVPELQSIAKLYNFDLHFAPFPLSVLEAYNAVGCGLEEGEWDVQKRPVCILGLEKEEDALRIAERAIGIRSIHKLVSMAPSLSRLHSNLRSLSYKPWVKHLEKDSWRFSMLSWGERSIQRSTQTAVIETFREILPMEGPINFKNPDVIFQVYYEFNLREDGTPSIQATDARMKEQDASELAQARMLYFSIQLHTGKARALMLKYEVRNRPFYGNTSMASELALMMANQGLARKGSLIYDPFCGTGSLPLAAAEFGAMCLGSDIDGRQMRGKKKDQTGILLSAAKYGTTSLIMDLLTYDITRCPLRTGGLFDAIITDPPYGVRAGAKRIGRKNEEHLRTEPVTLPDGRKTFETEDYLPPFKPYELSELAVDLVIQARWLLKTGGRLVFFLPVVNDSFEPVDIPKLDGMELIADSVQDFGNWARRLITMEKTRTEQDSKPVFDGQQHVLLEENARIPGHRYFREQYFNKFKPLDSQKDTPSPDA